MISAKVNYFNGQSWPDTRITKQRADRFTFHAPGWRPMAFSTLDAAKAKLQRHPGFVTFNA